MGLKPKMYETDKERQYTHYDEGYAATIPIYEDNRKHQHGLYDGKACPYTGWKPCPTNDNREGLTQWNSNTIELITRKKDVSNPSNHRRGGTAWGLCDVGGGR
eukprot:TRINITY_DN49819_c0_g1_i1.p3 TRINITY_DN49819_c0_g1~~TRINITY_DN49819_c0_g1_i1.p3  ORF type:complete len:103 (+),score=7.31 TRINITY_DN49819_c0_g1_i1:201-509(+)